MHVVLMQVHHLVVLMQGVDLQVHKCSSISKSAEIHFSKFVFVA